jgi:transposase InsO family protein
MEFIVGLPMIEKSFDSIWVIVDHLTKSTHFIPVKTNYHPHHYADLCFQQVVRLHGVPKSIVSDRGPQFIARFWERLHQNLGTNLIRSSAYHPQTSGQTERVNQILEDMLRTRLISCKGS